MIDSIFVGRSLSVSTSTTMAINPNLPEAHGLKGWYVLYCCCCCCCSPLHFRNFVTCISPNYNIRYDQEGAVTESKSLSSAGGGSKQASPFVYMADTAVGIWGLW